MASEVLKLTAQIVMSHVSMSELSPDELVDEIKEIYNVLSSLEGGAVLEDLATTLKTHLRKAHNLMPKEYFQRFGLDPKKFPLVCKEYSEQRSKLAKERGLGAQGGRRKATS